MKFIKFKPAYFERVWGGTKIETLLKRDAGAHSAPIGESWEIADRPEAESVAVGGEFDGMALAQILEMRGPYIMGGQWRGGRFPALVKWIDAAQALSIQVHPSSESAKLLGAESKNENWFIARAEPGASIIAGFKAAPESAGAERLSDGAWLRENLRQIEACEGDSIFIPGGCVHAIGAGNLILEIQENSDTTYRLYDWDRLGSDGKPRALHIKESAACVDFSLSPQAVKTDRAARIAPQTQNSGMLLCDFGLFEIRHIKMAKGAVLTLAEGCAKIISAVRGSLADSEGCAIGEFENALVPAGETAELRAESDAEILVTKIKLEK